MLQSKRPLSALAAVLLATVLDGGAAGAAERTLVRTDELRRAALSGRREGWDFAVTGTVTAVLKYSKFVLEDESGRFSFSKCSVPLPAVGDRVGVNGYIINDNTRREGLIIRDNLDIRRLGRAAAVPVTDVPIAQLADPKLDMRNVRIEGTLIGVTRDEADDKWELLLVKDGADTALAAFWSGDSPTPTPHRALVDAKVSVSGVCFRNVSGLRCCLGPYVEVADDTDITVVTPPPDDPFDAPPLETFGLFNAAEIAAMGRRSLVGPVAATWLPNRACVLEDDGHPVLVSFADDITLPPTGHRLRACGLPGTDLYAINLGRARWRDEPGILRLPETSDLTATNRPFLSSDTSALRAQRDLLGKIVTFSGRIGDSPAGPAAIGRRLLSNDDGHVLLDCSTHPEIVHRLPAGCRAKVTGVCIYEAEEAGPHSVLPHLKDRLLVIRSESDVTILAAPPWWTIRRLFLFVCLLLLVIGLLILRSAVQKRRARLRVEERTRLAVELHDTLSQNLAAASFEIAAARNAPPDDPGGTERHIDTADRMLRSSRTQLRQCLWDLRTDTLNDPNFSQAIENTVRLVAGSAAVRIRSDVSRAALDDSTAHGILSILRELVSNAVRHGQATSVRIAGARDKDEIAFSVTGDGYGFDTGRAPGPGEGHFGLVGIHDRVRGLGGTFEITSAPNRGTRAVIRFNTGTRKARK